MSEISDQTGSGENVNGENVSEDVDREHVKRVLRERAQALAKSLDEADLEETYELVTIDLGGPLYAIEAALVREVLAVKNFAPLPTAPDFVLGLINVRGRIIALIDLRAVLGHEAASSPSGQVAIVEAGGVEVAVDARECGVARIPHSRLLPMTEQRKYWKAVTVDDVGLIDIESIVGETRQSAASLASGPTS